MRILIVEDNQKIAQSLKKGLKQEAFAIDLAPEGEYAFDMAMTEDYDLIILDLMLPKMSGTQVCQKLRSKGKTTPILMLTAKSQTEDKIKGLNCGADDYLSKPFSFEELLARIKAILRRPSKSLNPVLKYQNLSLNTNTLEVKRKNKKIKLTKKEYALLEYFLRNQGQILSKQQIINHVWDFDADILPNTVEVYVGYLRQKLGKPKLIKTVRGFGYQLGEK